MDNAIYALEAYRGAIATYPDAAYQRIQATRPQTLGVALTDSPVGLAASVPLAVTLVLLARISGSPAGRNAVAALFGAAAAATVLTLSSRALAEPPTRYALAAALAVGVGLALRVGIPRVRAARRNA